MSSVCFDISAHRNPTAFQRVRPQEKKTLQDLASLFFPLHVLQVTCETQQVSMWSGEGGSFQSKPKSGLDGHCWNSTTRNARNPFVYYILLKGASQPEQGMPIKSVFAVESALHVRARSDKRSRVGISDGTASRSADSSHSTLLWKLLSRSRNGLRTDVRRRPRLPQTPRSLLRVKVKLTGSR